MLLEYHRGTQHAGQSKKLALGSSRHVQVASDPAFFVGLLERLRSKSCFLNFKRESSYYSLARD